MKKEYFRNLYKPRKNVIRTTALSPKNNNKSVKISSRHPANSFLEPISPTHPEYYTRVKLLNESSSAHLRHERNSKMSMTKPGTQELGGLEGGDKRFELLEDPSININIDIL